MRSCEVAIIWPGWWSLARWSPKCGDESRFLRQHRQHKRHKFKSTLFVGETSENTCFFFQDIPWSGSSGSDFSQGQNSIRRQINRYVTHVSFLNAIFNRHKVILLMEEILHQLIGSLSHHLQGFIHPRWLFRISSINGMIGFQENCYQQENCTN